MLSGGEGVGETGAETLKEGEEAEGVKMVETEVVELRRRLRRREFLEGGVAAVSLGGGSANLIVDCTSDK